MTYLRRFSSDMRGFVLIDIILALSLAVVCVSGLTTASISAREIFDRARLRAGLLDAYIAHRDEFADLMPYEARTRSYAAASTSIPMIIEGHAKWYGNDRIETDIKIVHRDQSIDLVQVRNFPFASADGNTGISICSPLITIGEQVGSYGSIHRKPVQPIISITPITLPIDPLLPLTDLEVRNGTAYISTDSTKASDPDIIIAGIADPEHAVIRSSINTGPGISSIALGGEYLYGAAASTVSQLHVIHMESLDILSLVAKYKLPSPASSTTPPFASAVFYDRHKIYLGTEKWDGEELSIVDVTVPDRPSKIGGLETGSKVNDILVRGDIAHIAASDEKQLRLVSVSHPASPFEISLFSPSGWQRQEGKSLSSFEDSLGFGRTSGGFNLKADHELFSWPTATSSLTDPFRSIDVSGGIYGIIDDRENTVVITRTPDQEITILPRSLATSTVLYHPLPVAPQTLTCDGHRLYVLARTAPVIYEISFTQPQN